MDRFAAFEAFTAVSDHGSFAGAARALGQSPASLTRIIAALEAHLGVTLFHRSTRKVALSHEGAALLERLRPLLADLRETEHLMKGGASAPQGALHITAPVKFGRLHVLPVVAALLREHDQLSVRMMLYDRNVRIIEEGIDVALRIGDLTDSSLLRIALGRVRRVLVSSPDYLARKGTPQDPKELTMHDCIEGSPLRPDNIWRLGEKGEIRQPIEPRLSVSDVSARIAACEAGAGICNLLSYQVAEALREGRLVRVLEDFAPAPVPVQLLYHPSRAAMPGLRVFIEAMREKARRENWREAFL